MQTGPMERLDYYIQLLRKHRPKKFSVNLLFEHMPPGLACSERTIQRDIKKLIDSELAKEMNLRWGKDPYWIALPKFPSPQRKIAT